MNLSNPRQQALIVLKKVFIEGQSLSALLPQQLEELKKTIDRALAQEIIYGVVRWYPRLEFLLHQLMQKPLKKKDKPVELIIFIGLYQLIYMRVPDYAAINETIGLINRKKQAWAAGLVNGVLRSFVRDKAALIEKADQDDVAKTAHPEWLVLRLKHDWPEDYLDIIDANNGRAPMTLRVNARQQSREQYLELCENQNIEVQATSFSPYGLCLKSPVDVKALPGFAEGSVSVQDEAAQLASVLIDVQPDQRVLDACAAPGGKTAAILESAPNSVRVLAIDNNEDRLSLVNQTLERLKLNAEVQCVDASIMDKTWAAETFDRILLDVPCSATGVIRRNPDIKFFRRDEDISVLVETQAKILNSAWKVLRQRGMLLYATCSIMRDENENQIVSFLNRTSDACEVKIPALWGLEQTAGRQILPGQDNMDGFYYALLQKK